MRPLMLFCFSMILLTQTGVAQKPEPQKVDGRIKWVYDYDEGKSLAKAMNKPMFVVVRCER